MSRRRLGAVIFPGFEMLDYFGPLEMFSFFPDEIEIVAVAGTMAPVTASGGPATMPDATFDDADANDILLVPGGEGTRAQVANPALIGWLSRAVAQAECVTSVCTGALLLARTGCLNGQPATTNKLAFDWVAGQAPDVDWQRDARWVKTGRIYTSSGVSAGIDMALAVIEDMLGAQAATKAVLGAEYNRNSDPGNDPFALLEEE